MIFNVHLRKENGKWTVACKESWGDVQPYSAYAQQCPGISKETYKALLGKFAVMD
jgi:hypothetical protein